jgi:hypothetical protein
MVAIEFQLLWVVLASKEAESAGILVGIAIGFCAGTAAPVGTGSDHVVGATIGPPPSLPVCGNVPGRGTWGGLIGAGALISSGALCWTNLPPFVVMPSEIGGSIGSISTWDEGEAASAGFIDFGGLSTECRRPNRTGVAGVAAAARRSDRAGAPKYQHLR